MTFFPIVAPHFVVTQLPDLEFWYRSDLGITGSPVSDWADQSTNSRDLAQATAASRPTYTASDADFNNHPSLTFDAVDDYMDIVSFVEVAQPLHLFMVLNQVSWAATGRILDLSSDNTCVVYQWSSTPDITQAAASDANAVSATVGTTYLLESFFDGASSYQRLNNASAVSGGNPGTNGMDQITLAAIAGGGTDSNIKVAEMFLCSSQLTGGTLSSARNYANNRYTIW